MDKRFFKTYVDTTLFDSKTYEFQIGRIFGLMEALCGGSAVDYKPFRVESLGVIFTTICTQEQYNKFVKHMEEHYPQICKFDLKKESE